MPCVEDELNHQTLLQEGLSWAINPEREDLIPSTKKPYEQGQEQ